MYYDQNCSKDANNCSYQAQPQSQQQQLQQQQQQHLQVSEAAYLQTSYDSHLGFHESQYHQVQVAQSYQPDASQLISTVNENDKDQQPNDIVTSIEVEEIVDSESLQLTKKGTPRLRRKFVESAAERKAAKLRKKIEDHRLMPVPCTEKCKFKCPTLIAESQRESINSRFWRLNYDERRSFVLYSCIRMDVRNPSLQRTRNRLNTFKYHLKDENGSFHNVCKSFFLATLGFKRNNDSFIFKVLSETPKGQLKPLPLKRKPSRKPYPFHDSVDRHIDSYNPTMPAHRRKNSPNIAGYLPATLNAVVMHRDFREKYPDIPVSYQWYRNRLKARKIVFSFRATGARSGKSDSTQAQTNSNSGYEQSDETLQLQHQQTEPVSQTQHPMAIENHRNNNIQQQYEPVQQFQEPVSLKQTESVSVSIEPNTTKSIDLSLAVQLNSMANKVVTEEEEEVQIQYTKKGTPRMRRKFDLTLSERKALKAKRKAELHPVQAPCSQGCIFECTKYFEDERRLVINRQFWEMDIYERKAFVLFSCERCPIRRRYTKPDQRKRDRDLTLRYYLKDDQDRMHRVCKVFFLTTLGFKPRNDKFVYSVLTNTPRGELAPQTCPKPRSTPHHKQTPEEEKEARNRLIEQHIQSYNPRLPPYLHRKAPKIRGYLPHNLSVASMFKDFKTMYPDSKVHYQLYLKYLKDARYSFMPGSSKVRNNSSNNNSKSSNKTQPAVQSINPVLEPEPPIVTHQLILTNSSTMIIEPHTILENVPVPMIDEQVPPQDSNNLVDSSSFLNARLILENLT